MSSAAATAEARPRRAGRRRHDAAAAVARERDELHDRLLRKTRRVRQLPQARGQGAPRADRVGGRRRDHRSAGRARRLRSRAGRRGAARGAELSRRRRADSPPARRSAAQARRHRRSRRSAPTSIRTCTRPWPTKSRPARAKAKSSARCARAINSAIGCSGPRWCAWPKHREQARLLRGPRRASATPAIRRSRAPIASWRSSSIPIAIPGDKAAEEQVQGSGRGLRGPRRRRQARALRSLRPRRGRPARPAPAASIRRSSPSSTTSSAASATFSASAGCSAAAAAAARSAAPIFATTSRSSSSRRRTASRPTIQIPRHETLRDLQRIGRGAGHHADDVPAVPRHRPAALSAGLLHRRAHLRPVPRQRKVITKPCPTCHGAGSDRAAAQAHGEDSRGHRHRSAPAPDRRRRSRRARRSARRSLRRHRRATSTRSSSATATTSRVRFPVNFTTLALGGEIKVPIDRRRAARR